MKKKMLLLDYFVRQKCGLLNKIKIIQFVSILSTQCTFSVCVFGEEGGGGGLKLGWVGQSSCVYSHSLVPFFLV